MSTELDHGSECLTGDRKYGEIRIGISVIGYTRQSETRTGPQKYHGYAIIHCNISGAIF